VPDRPASPLDVLLPSVTDLSVRQQELASHSNVKRMLLGVYNATNRARDIVAKYEDPVPAPEVQLPQPPPKP
jgi:hypothetical protein